MTQITSVLQEARLFQPPKAFVEKAKIRSLEEYRQKWAESIRDPDKYWQNEARARLDWHTPFTRGLNWKEPHATWFEDGHLNASYNCLDRHVLNGLANKPAIIWEGEPGDQRTLTYGELLASVQKAAAALESLGVQQGDRVAIYLPMIPEMVIAMLACARLGAAHCVVFGGFSAEALAERCNDCEAKVIVTADGGWRKGQAIPLKANVDEAMTQIKSVRHVVVVKRTASSTAMKSPRDLWWDELLASQKADHRAEAHPSETPLFLLYTSGSTGKPKGILHTTGGYLTGVAATMSEIFDLRSDDVFWCTADCGWVTGHSYLVYGPLLNAATILIYEGAPNHPDVDRFWDLIDRHRVTIFYTAPTAIRSFMKWGDEPILRHRLESLRLLGTVGEPINPEAWEWYHRLIGKQRCPIVDTWWQTETGMIMIAPFPGATPTKPGTATLPFFGIEAEVVDREGKPVAQGNGGFLVIKKPWPSMLRTIYGNDERYKSAYWDHVPGMYFTGDGARRDEDGYLWILGRIDDVLNVSGHRLSTMEIESSLVSFPDVAEAAVVGKPDAIKGEAIACFVSLKAGISPSEDLKKALIQHVVKHIGALARPDEIRFSEALPKTRSGKIMRRLLRDIAAGRESNGDTTTLEDLSVLAALRAD